MPIVSTCTHEGCSTLTIGPTCIEHEVRTKAPKIRRRTASPKRALAVK